MTRLIYACLLLGFLLPAAAVFADTAKDEIVAESKIRDVTVYADRAKIKRVATVSIPAGAHTVVFKGLPAILFPDSLRAEGSAKADVKFGAVTQKQVMSAQLTTERQKELNDKIEALEDQVTVINAEKAAIDARKTFLASLGQQAKLRSDEEIAQIDLKPDQWAAASQQIYNGVSDALKAQVQNDLKLRDLNRQIASLQGEMSQLGSDQRSTFTVSVPLEASSATDLSIELSYQISNATWKPVYDARLETAGKGNLKFVQFGNVSQQTGEDWNGVALTLSTAQPQRGASLPELAPMWVNAYEMNRGYGGGVAYNKSAERATTFHDMSSNMAPSVSNLQIDSVDAFEGGGPAAAPAPKPAQFAAAQINNGGFVTEYKIPGPAEVLSDGTETKLMVGAFDTSSVLEIHVKPQLASEAYLVSKMKLKGDSPILPGQVNLFRDGAFVGQSAIKLLRPDEEYGLYFGIDDQVAVKRKTLKDERQEQGVIARDSVQERQYVTEIQNLHKEPISLVVKETIPVPQNEKVKVELEKDFTTPGYVEDSQNIKGLLQWAMPVEPKAKQEVKLGWTISWPKDMQLSGLQ